MRRLVCMSMLTGFGLALCSVPCRAAASYSAVLSGTALGMVCNGSTLVGSDGNTADADGLMSAIAAAAALPGGAEIELPPGQCEFNREIDIPVSSSIRLAGAGVGLSTLQFFTPATASAAVANGLVFSITNSANLTVDDFTVSRLAGSNLGQPFLGTAISISAGTTSPNAGSVLLSNLTIESGTVDAPSDSWNTGILEVNLSQSELSDVDVALANWQSLPNPAAYTCSVSGASVPCAIHALESPFSQTQTPANLGFGVATAVAIEGVGTTFFASQTGISDLTVSGGLTGVDAKQVIGLSVDSSRVAGAAYGVRAETAGMSSQQITISNSSFLTTVAGLYANNLSTIIVSNNTFAPTDSGTTGLPNWSAVWLRNVSGSTISTNTITGVPSSVGAEYGIYLSADAPNNTPASVSSNSLSGLTSPGSVCLGNNANVTTIAAVGNSLSGCADSVSDATGSDGYSNNDTGASDLVDNGLRQVTLPESMTIGSASTTGTLQIITDGVQKFLANGSGNVQASGGVSVAGALRSSATISGNPVVSQSFFALAGYNGHSASKELVGATGGQGGGTVNLVPSSGSFPNLTGGYATLVGELTCSDLGQNSASWHIVGHYTVNGTTLQPKAFSATLEPDANSQSVSTAATGGNSIRPQLNPTVLGIQVVFGSGISVPWSCSSELVDLVTD